jgi:two-component system KDP operon response regulator KdpE
VGELPGVDLDAIHSSTRPTVLVVEDEADTVLLLKHILRLAGFDVLGALNGFEAVQKASDSHPDLILLDLMMPDLDGWQTYQHLRQTTDVPVVIVSAIHNKDEIIRALRMGVDDYVTKPFVNAEIVARVQAVLRRARPSRHTDRLVFPHSDLIIDFATQEVILQQKRIQLTGKEFAILATLARSAPDVVQYRVIAEAVWGKDNPQVRNRIKYLVYLLRQKLEDASGKPDLIQNIDRLGYKLQVTG